MISWARFGRGAPISIAASWNARDGRAAGRALAHKLPGAIEIAALASQLRLEAVPNLLHCVRHHEPRRLHRIVRPEVVVAAGVAREVDEQLRRNDPRAGILHCFPQALLVEDSQLAKELLAIHPLHRHDGRC
jgi:hypothetical protein